MKHYTLPSDRPRGDLSTYLVILLCGFILLKPSLLEQDELANASLKLATAALFVILAAAFYLQRVHVPRPMIVFALFRIGLLVPTVTHGGDLANWGYTSVSQLSVLMLIILMSSNTASLLRLLRALSDLLLVYLAINAWMVVTSHDLQRVWDNGYIETWYLLGLRTRITDCFFTAIALSMTCDALRHRIIGLRSIVILVLGVYQLFSLSVSTAQVGLALGLISFAAFRAFPWTQRLLSMKRATFVGLALSLLLVLARIQYTFGDLFVDLFGKEASFTGRTDLWDIGLPIAMQEPVLGHGVNGSFGAFIPFAGNLWQSHNQWLQVFYDGGLVGLLLFGAFLLTSTAPFDTLVSPATKAPMLAAYLAFSVMMATEIYTYNMALFYLLPFLASRFGVFSGSDGQAIDLGHRRTAAGAGRRPR